MHQPSHSTVWSWCDSPWSRGFALRAAHHFIGLSGALPSTWTCLTQCLGLSNVAIPRSILPMTSSHHASLAVISGSATGLGKWAPTERKQLKQLPQYIGSFFSGPHCSPFFNPWLWNTQPTWLSKYSVWWLAALCNALFSTVSNARSQLFFLCPPLIRRPFSPTLYLYRSNPLRAVYSREKGFWESLWNLSPLQTVFRAKQRGHFVQGWSNSASKEWRNCCVCGVIPTALCLSSGNFLHTRLLQIWCYVCVALLFHTLGSMWRYSQFCPCNNPAISLKVIGFKNICLGLE